MIREIGIDTLEKSGVLELIWRVFEEFDAPEYVEEGIAEFKDFIAPETMKQRMQNEALFLWGYFDGETILGMIAAKPPCHIALLFVEKAYHGRGIARSLYHTVLSFYQSNSDHREITVHSSPYAVEIYRKLGFVDTDVEQTVNGLRFIPMKHVFR